MPSVKSFLKERIVNAGIGAVFGLPGDYILGTYKSLEDDPNIELVGTTDEAMQDLLRTPMLGSTELAVVVSLTMLGLSR